MKKIIIRLLAFIFCLLSIDVNAQTLSGTESERIKGVANFLLDRANDNFFYIFEINLQNNTYFAHYFPNTHYYAKSGHLKTLLRSGGTIWKESIEKDLDCVLRRTTGTILKKTDNYIKGFTDQYILLLQHLEIEIDGTDYPLHYIPIDATQKVKDTINEFYNYANKAFFVELQKGANEALSFPTDVNAGIKNVCINNDLPTVNDFSLLEQKLMKFKAKADILKQQVAVFKKYKDDLHLREDKIMQILSDNDNLNQLQQSFNLLEAEEKRLQTAGPQYRDKLQQVQNRIGDTKRSLVKLKKRIGSFSYNQEQLYRLALSIYGEEMFKEEKGNITALINKGLPDDVGFFITSFETRFYNYIEFYLDIKDELAKLIKKYPSQSVSKNNNTIKVIEIEKILMAAIERKVFPFLNQFDEKRFNQLKRYMLFFAEVADAKTAQSVKVLLTEVTMPPVSFGKKRSKGEEKWLITAYLGSAVGQEESQTTKREEFVGLFAPVGLEYTFSRHDGYSHSVMLSPLDFGHPINLEIHDRDESVKVGDIFVPGIYYSLGLKDLPLTIGFGFNKGKALKDDYRDEERWLIFFAFDMPLFTLY